METKQYHRAMEAFCRQRAKMEGESERFWLAEAEVLAKLAMNAQDVLIHPSMVEEKGLPNLGA
jgi:hypothetical protein